MAKLQSKKIDNGYKSRKNGLIPTVLVNSIKPASSTELCSQATVSVVIVNSPLSNHSTEQYSPVTVPVNSVKPASVTEHSSQATVPGSSNTIEHPSRAILTIACPEFNVNEIIWAKIKGFSHWPAKIERIITRPNGSVMYEVRWYNDYRKTKLYKLQVFKFFENFEKYAEKFNDVIGLKVAAFEAMYEYRKNMT